MQHRRKGGRGTTLDLGKTNFRNSSCFWLRAVKVTFIWCLPRSLRCGIVRDTSPSSHAKDLGSGLAAWDAVLRHYAMVFSNPPHQAMPAQACNFTPVLMPTTAVHVLLAFSRLCKGTGRRMLMLCSDKVSAAFTSHLCRDTNDAAPQAYTQQTDLLGCDAFTMSHEGSVSFMVNLHAVGLLCERLGGASVHTSHSVLEQGVQLLNATSRATP